MLSTIGIGLAIIGIGVNLGLSFLFIPPRGGQGEWFVFFLVCPAMIFCAGLFGILIEAHLGA